MNEEIKKKVDEEWKQKAQQEKLHNEKKIDEDYKGKIQEEINFNTFIAGLVAQALIHLGVIENPATKKAELDIEQAKYTIDILQILEEKTKGNLTPEEAEYLKNVLHELRLGFVKVSKK